MKWRYTAIIKIAFFQSFTFQSLSVIGAWHAIASRVRWDSPADVKAAYRNASFIAGNRVIFNINGNDYRLVAAMQRINQVWDAKPKSPEANELEVLSLLIEEYEQKHVSGYELRQVE